MMVSHWSLSDNKPHQVSSPSNNPLMTVQRAPITIGIIVTFIIIIIIIIIYSLRVFPIS